MGVPGQVWSLGAGCEWQPPRGSAQLPSLCTCRQPCLQYWPEPGRQQYGLMEVEFVSGTADEDLVARVFRVQNISRVSDLGAPGGNWGDGMVCNDLQVTRDLVTGAHVPLLAVPPKPQLQEGHLLVRHFQFLRWSAYRDTPDSKKAFLHLLAEVDRWQAESGDGRTVVHCL